MATACVPCWTRETLRCRFSVSVLNSAVDNVPIRLPPPGCINLVFMGISGSHYTVIKVMTLSYYRDLLVTDQRLEIIPYIDLRLFMINSIIVNRWDK
jgi:hypothetical protein